MAHLDNKLEAIKHCTTQKKVTNFKLETNLTEGSILTKVRLNRSNLDQIGPLSWQNRINLEIEVNCTNTLLSDPWSARQLCKSDDLQYNTLVCWFAGTNDLSTKNLMFQVLFSFHNFLENSFQKLFLFILLSFYNLIKKMQCIKTVRRYEKKK